MQLKCPPAHCLSRRQLLVCLTLVLLFGAHSLAAAAAPGTSLPSSPGATVASDPLSRAPLYENGESVALNYQEALALYCEAAHRGEPAAFLAIGWMYLNGRGVARSDTIAVRWFRKAAEHNVPQAANLLNLLSGIPAAESGGCPSHKGVAVGPRNASGRTILPPASIRKLIEETAAAIGISSNLLGSVISVESGFNPNAVSKKNAAGLMQLMPGTAKQLGVPDPFNPHDNVRAGARYLRSLLQTYDGNLTLALAAYNAGQRAVRAHRGVPPFRETGAYIAKVKRLCACE